MIIINAPDNWRDCQQSSGIARKGEEKKNRRERATEIDWDRAIEGSIDCMREGEKGDRLIDK